MKFSALNIDFNSTSCYTHTSRVTFCRNYWR